MVWPSRFHIYPVYTEQKLSESRCGSRSRLRSGSRPEDVLVHTGHALFNTTKRIILLFIV